MQAKVGDRIIVKGHHIGEPDRDAEIVTVGPDSGPPFTVRWDDTGHETLSSRATTRSYSISVSRARTGADPARPPRYAAGLGRWGREMNVDDAFVGAGHDRQSPRGRPFDTQRVE